MDDEIDPLDAYMKTIDSVLQRETAAHSLEAADGVRKQEKQGPLLLPEPEELPLAMEEFTENAEKTPSIDLLNAEELIALAQKKAKKKDLMLVDHATTQYEPFRKNFYVEASQIAKMTDEQVRAYRLELDNIKIRGTNCPRPIKKWTQAGLSQKILEIIRKLDYARPTPIQAQAIPAIMSGRDVLGVAKTGSGKTIAYLLPMFRHLMDQRPLGPMEGPIALIMTPTRELALQVVTECKKFCQALGYRAVCAYGGSAIKDQIGDLKRGAEIIVCTPGRMIDLLCANSGRVTNLRRVTFVVLDEADRMFDLGFEPQVMKIVHNIRPSRQTVLFSATFPRQMEGLARKILAQPLEITVGGRSGVVCQDVAQMIEVVDEGKKFFRLLEILGHWFEDKEVRVLIFVERQDAADNLFRDLIKKGYICISIHGGKDQADRDSSLFDFKSGNVPILIATSVAARGLDVKELNLVINYECPNHMEDYVHRVGRTGRAGHKGTAITFITPSQDKYAGDLVKALKNSDTIIPDELKRLAEEFSKKVEAGHARYASGGFGGKGLDHIDKEREKFIQVQKRSFGEVEEEPSDDSASENEAKLPKAALSAGTIAPLATISQTSTAAHPVYVGAETAPAPLAAAAASKAQADALHRSAPSSVPGGPAPSQVLSDIAKKIAARALESGFEIKDKVAEINARFRETSAVSGEVFGVRDEHTQAVRGYRCELEINDYPQHARWKVTTRDVFATVQEHASVSITTRGSYFAAGTQPSGKERKLFLLIESESELNVSRAKKMLLDVILEATMEAASRGTLETGSKYSVI